MLLLYFEKEEEEEEEEEEEVKDPPPLPHSSRGSGHGKLGRHVILRLEEHCRTRDLGKADLRRGGGGRDYNWKNYE